MRVRVGGRWLRGFEVWLSGGPCRRLVIKIVSGIENRVLKERSIDVD